MTISRNSALYKTAYFWSLPEEIPETTNLFVLIARIIFSVIIMPMLFLLILVVGFLWFLPGVLIAPLFGYYPNARAFSDPSKNNFNKINCLPTIKGFRLLPIYPIVIGILAYLYFYELNSPTKQYFSVLLIIFLAINGLSLIIKYRQKLFPSITFTDSQVHGENQPERAPDGNPKIREIIPL